MSSITREGTLVLSNNTGRYALDDAVWGPDITAGMALDVWLGGHWVGGRVEHTGRLYAQPDEPAGRAGYYFRGADGAVCGLCVGMRVRVPV